MNSARKENEAIAEAAARWVVRCDGGLGAAERAEFERWRQADPRHETALAHYTSTWSALDRPLRAGAVIHEMQRRIRRRRVLVGAAAAAGLLAVGLLQPWSRSLSDALLVDGQSRGVVLAPEKRSLPDGSVVELRRGAEIAVEFTPSLRRVVLLRGEAHFQVEKNKERPFAVEAGGVQVRAVGTAFLVQRAAEQIEIVVTEGRVAVEKPVLDTEIGPALNGAPDKRTPEVQTLALAEAGQRFVYSPQRALDPAPALVTVSPTELAERLAWRAPRLEFSGTALAEAIAMMNRASPAGTKRPRLAIDPASTSLAREPVSGVFRADNTEMFVRMLELSLGVQAERHDDRIVLRKAP